MSTSVTESGGVLGAGPGVPMTGTGPGGISHTEPEGVPGAGPGVSVTEMGSGGLLAIDAGPKIAVTDVGSGARVTDMGQALKQEYLQQTQAQKYQ